MRSTNKCLKIFDNYILQYRSTKCSHKAHNGFNTLAIVRNTPKLIIFSENFFGRHVVRQKHEFETLLKQHTSRFEDTIFAINYLDTEQTDISVADVDRTLIILSSCEYYQVPYE